MDALQTRVWSTEGWEKEEDSTDDECSIAEQGGHQGAPTDGQPQDDGQAVASGSTSRPPLPHQSRSTSMSAETHQGAATASPADEDQANASKTSAQKKPKRSKTIATRPREYYAIDEVRLSFNTPPPPYLPSSTHHGYPLSPPFPSPVRNLPLQL